MYQETPSSNPHAGKSEADLKEEIRLALEAADTIAAKLSQRAHANEYKPRNGSSGGPAPISHSSWELVD